MAKYSEIFIEKVREANDIVEFIGETVTLKPSGRNLKGLCPFHSEKTPSFMVHPEKQIFRCFGCGVGGNVFHFLMKLQNLQFPQAVEYLAERARIPLPKTEFQPHQDEDKKKRDDIYTVNDFARTYFHQVLMNSDSAAPARKYLLEKRKVSKEIITQFRLGYARPDWDDLLNAAQKKGFSRQLLETSGLISPRQSGGTGFYDRFRDQVIYPIVDAQNRVTGFGGRFLDNREPKYLNSPETQAFSKSRNLYALPQAINEIRGQKFAILMEGYMDVLRAHQCGITNAVATLGTALTIEQAKILKRYCMDVVLMYDTDKAGIQAALRGLEPLVSSGLNVKVVTLPSGKDPDEYLLENTRDKFLNEISNAKTPVEFALALTIEEFGLDSVHAKASVFNAIFPLIFRISQEVDRELYLRLVAERIGLDKDTVFKQYHLKKKSQKNPTLQVTDSFELLEKGRIQMERELIRLLLNAPQYIAQTKSAMQISDFVDPLHQTILETIFQVNMEEMGGNTVKWLDYFENEEIVDIVSFLLMNENGLENPEAIFQGYLRKFNQQKIKQTQLELKEKMKQAEKSGDTNLYNELQNQFVQLQKTTLTSFNHGSSAGG